MGLEVHRQTFYGPLVPNVVSEYSAETSSRELSAALVSHECLLEGSAQSHPSGLASAVGSLLGSRFEASPAQAARAREQQPVNLMDLDFWAEPPVAPDSASVPHSDALHHRSVTEVGTEGQVQEHPICSTNYNITTPKSTLPVATTHHNKTCCPVYRFPQ